ncbi:MAG: ABC transporter permease [Lachnospiraceae bacterium]|nr:ABC transporter permease [Lachnospiraceae bacterium]MDD7147670.1 ABC transporter permease [Lachnospiraceae bacterium]MDY4068463.1 ABC transporter permease [Lachnospiraceae bacterium]
MSNVLTSILSAEFFFSIIRITSPILFATLGAVIVEKAGISNIGLEGIMMISALFGSLCAYWSSSWFVGLLAAMIVGVIVALVMSVFAFQLKTDIILVGIAINMIGSGGTIFLVKSITNMTEGEALSSTTSLITSELQIPTIQIPLIHNIPVIGPVFSGHSLLTYVAFLLVFLTWVLLYKTSLGLNLRSVGENPNAASSVGVSVTRVRYTAMALSGLMAGLGGAFMSMSYAMGWSLNMVAGRGFIALAAQAMGSGEPFGAMLATIVFGFAQAFGIKLSSIGLDSNLSSPIPYIITIIGLVVFAIIKRKRDAKRVATVGAKQRKEK